MLPASRIARPSRRLTTVATIVSATSSSVAAPEATVLRSLKTYVPTRYSFTTGLSPPESHIVGVPPTETVWIDRPRRSIRSLAAVRNASEPGGAG